MSAVTAFVALPATVAAILVALRTPLANRLVAHPATDRWHRRPTPLLGGVGIACGLSTAVAAALATGALEPTAELFGILGGCALLFVAGLVDDAVSLAPLLKLAAQVAAAGIVLASGLTVEIVDNDVLAFALGLAWYVGMTNAFNLLDNMNALAATLAAVAAGYFALDAAFVHDNPTVLVLALSVAFACAGFLPFNVGRARSRPLFMGDSGSQMLGFALASFGLASTWTVAGSTFASILVPIIVLGVPILDTGLVALVRLREGRPIHQGGLDHWSHRLVYRGLSEVGAVAVLAGIGLLLGGTSLAYGLLDNTTVALVGVLLTFTLLVQFVSYLVEIERSPLAADEIARRPFVRRLLVSPRRLLEVLLDFALVSAAFLAAYLLVVGGSGTPFERYVFLLTLPTLLVSRYLVFIVFGLYKRVWRYAGPRDMAAVAVAVAVSELPALAPTLALDEIAALPLRVFVVDALLCTVFIAAARSAERAIDSALASVRQRERRRTLIVGAGRAGRSLLRELQETPGEQVVGFVDDDRALHGRRLRGALVVGGWESIDPILTSTRPDVVLVSVPDAPRERLDGLVAACARRGVACRFVRRQIDAEPGVVLRTAAE